MTNNPLPAVTSADPTADWNEADWAEFHDDLYRLNCDCGAAGDDDRARVLAAYCIGQGVNVVGRIIKALVPLGFDHRHIGALLTQDKGGWFRVGPGNVVTLLKG